MNGKASWRSWAILIVLLVVFGLITALWSSIAPSIGLGGGGAASGNRIDIPSVPVEVEPIEFEIAALGIGPFELAPIVAVGILAVVSIGGIAIVGAVIAFINMLISRQVTAVTEDNAYKEKQATLEQRQKEELKQMNVGRSTSTPDHNRPGWSSVSTSLIILFFVWMVALLINGTVYPEGARITADGEITNSATLFIVPLMLMTLLFLGFWMRPGKMAAATESTDSAASIPWDTLAVIVLGLLVVGLGLAAMLFLF